MCIKTASINRLTLNVEKERLPPEDGEGSVEDDDDAGSSAVGERRLDESEQTVDADRIASEFMSE